MADMKENYILMFTDYPDIVNLDQMRKMLSGISNTLAYRMLRQLKNHNKFSIYVFLKSSEEVFIYELRNNKK